MKILHLVIFWFFFCSAGFSQGIQWDVYSVNDTFQIYPMNFVYAANVDHDGAVWFGVDSKGVYKYDGINWTNYNSGNSPIPDNMFAIAVDKDNNKWFGTSGGARKFDGTNWQIYSTTDGLAANLIHGIGVDTSGTVWFGTDAGVSSYDGQQWKTYTMVDGLANNHVWAVVIDAENNKWFATGGGRAPGGVSKFDGTTWTTYDSSDGLVGTVIGSAAIDREGNKWFGVIGPDGSFAGAYKYDGTQFTNYTRNSGLSSNEVPAIAVDSAGIIWFGSGNTAMGRCSGVSRYDSLGDSAWARYKNAPNAATYLDQGKNCVFCIAVDLANNKWLGTAGTILKLSETNDSTGIVRYELENMPLDLKIISNRFFRSVVFITGSDADAVLYIFALDGALIRSFTGKKSFIWDGINGFGKRANPGMYFYEMSVNGQKIKGHFLLLQ